MPVISSESSTCKLTKDLGTSISLLESEIPDDLTEYCSSQWKLQSMIMIGWCGCIFQSEKWMSIRNTTILASKFYFVISISIVIIIVIVIICTQTISVAVIAVELTGNLQMLLPCIIVSVIRYGSYNQHLEIHYQHHY